ncbi:MAG: acetolactate synthase 2 catalytic subunit [Myxococcota bacterium]
MNGARALIETLEALGVDLVFGYPGGAILPVYDALVDSSLRHILTRHEQASAFAADAYARANGRVGVCIATSGPGATNLITGIANAYIDSVPMVVITGQVPTSVMGTDAFQEVDIFGMTMSVVKHSFLVRDADDIPRIVTEAFQIAASGRPGPVLIDLPKDVANAEVTVRPTALSAEPVDPPAPTAEAIAKANELLAAARRPVLYVGGGVVLGRAIEPLRDFAERTGIPTVGTLKGLGALPTEHPQFLGMLGMHGTKAANLAVQGSDLLICVGARFDDRATGNLKGFAPDAAVIHLDVDAAEIGKLRKAQAAVLGDLRSSLPRLGSPGDIEGWQGYCQDLKQTHRVHYDAPGPAIHAPRLLREISMAGGDDLIVTCDVGQHQMWAAQHCRIDHPARHLSSSGLGAMGYGLPAAIGAQLACPDAAVVAVSGDGSIMINIQELVTMRRYDLPIKIVLLDNSMLGLVRQWQDLFHDQRRSEVDLSDNPDFAAVARSMGIEAFAVDTADEVPDAIERLFATEGPVLAHVRIDSTAQVWPLVPPGASNAVMLDGA